ncbi:hypothetical protein EJ110_NYTH44842 [Nymphaea thermarum]|nr:hypothetical protein EJ110_NYTH44842 [Nymphaea thermarum]
MEAARAPPVGRKRGGSFSLPIVGPADPPTTAGGVLPAVREKEEGGERFDRTPIFFNRRFKLRAEEPPCSTDLRTISPSTVAFLLISLASCSLLKTAVTALSICSHLTNSSAFCSSESPMTFLLPTGSATPRTSATSLSPTCCSANMGHVNNGRPELIPSIKEFHPQ